MVFLQPSSSGYTAPMGARFLSLATQSGTSQPNAVLFGPMIVLLIIVLIVLAICVGVLTRFARRRLIDEPAGRKKSEFVDPWAEAGRRIGESGKGSRPTAHPPADSDDDGDDNDDGEKAS